MGVINSESEDVFGYYEDAKLVVNPKDINAIADAIRAIMNSEELKIKLSKGSLEKAKGLTLQDRAKNIIKFMESKRNDAAK